MALAGAYAASLLLFFRMSALSGFDRGFSDRADGIIEISLLEHWRNVLVGAARWDMPGYFHPYPATLGYNDGYLLYGVDYAFWRLFADPMLADTLNLATFKSIGFFAAYALVARTLQWGRGAGMLVAAIFTVANGLTVQAGHAQVQSIALLPVAMLFAVAMVRAERDGRRRAACGLAVALALLMAAWLLTAFYMAWFTLLFAAMFVACSIVASGRWRPVALARLLMRHIAMVEAGEVTFAVALVPFLRVYLPKARETGGHAYAATLDYLVLPLDPLNVGSANYMWGWLVRLLPAAMPGGEHVTGIAPILFILSIAAFWIILRPRRAGAVAYDPALRAFAAAILLCWLATLQVGGMSAWALVYDLVAGAKGVRVVARFQLFLILPLLLLVAAAYRERLQRWRVRRPRALALLVAVLLAEQFGSDVPVQVSRTADGAVLWSVPPPPRGCRSFYVVAARRAEPVYVDAARTALYPHNVDAMLLAEHWRVPTINGFATFDPPDWNFADPLAADYDLRVARYVARHALSHVCRLDMRQQRPWTMPA